MYVAKCDSQSIDSLVRGYLSDSSERFERSAYSTNPAVFFGSSGNLGDKDYQVLNRTDFLVDDVSRTPWQADAFVRLIGPDLNWSIRASGFHGDTYEAAESADVCRTGIDGSEQCMMGPNGSPIRTEATRLALEGRRLFNNGDDKRIGVAPEFTYDLEAEDFQIEVPVYP